MKVTDCGLPALKTPEDGEGEYVQFETAGEETVKLYWLGADTNVIFESREETVALPYATDQDVFEGRPDSLKVVMHEVDLLKFITVCVPAAALPVAGDGS